ncbi:nuclear envelope integral membrane protein [Drosophila tropicalis]|uniref:nuclear envelope integral membrane protein n=1 Tax=Drosophila tropicalis TaxID=46794 RepID=UPI0035ABB346
MFNLWLFLLLPLSINAATPKADVVFLVPGTTIDITDNAYGSNTLRTYCYQGKRHSLLSLFETLEFQLSIANDEYTEYGGRTPEEVMEHYMEKRSLFSITLFSQKRQRVQLSPFEPQCLGIASRQPYNVNLLHYQVDIWRIAQILLGILIFWSSQHMAKNSVFYYLAGIALGICASVLVTIVMFAKLFPRRPMMYGVIVGGWTIGFYIIKQLMDNLRVILLVYRVYVLWYLVITGIISFLICYRIGPPRNPRSQNIIKWVLQAIGGALIYFASWHTNAAICIMVMIFVAHYFPQSLLNYCRSFYRRRFPPQRRLLTREEYYQQTVNETAKSLAELREYVNSPNCRQWNIMSSLRNPMRFATFANGEPHLFDEEIEDYSRTIEESMREEGAEELETEDYLQCNMYYRPLANRRSTGLNNTPRRYQDVMMNHMYNNGGNNNYNNSQRQQQQQQQRHPPPQDNSDSDNDVYMEQDDGEEEN